MSEFVKMSELVNGEFTVEKSLGYQWKKWDADQKRMLTADSYAEGYRKIYSLETSKGRLDVSSNQLGQCLEAVFQDGIADIIGKTFSVKSNGQTGKEIRYYINRAKQERPVPKPEDNLPTDAEVMGGEIEHDLSSIPF